MSLSQILHRIEKFTVDNSPLILTSIGVAGTVTTAVLAGKASYKAALLIRNEEANERFAANLIELQSDNRIYLSTFDRLKLVWPYYIPSATIGTITIVSIISANRIGTRRAAAMAAAYTLAERGFEEYREKIISKIGERTELEYRDEIAQDRVRKNPITQQDLIITGRGGVPCFDTYSGRYFQSEMESLKKAQNDLNYRILNHGYASVNDFYDLIGLPHIEIGEEMGWTSDELLEIYFSTTMTDDQQPAISLEFRAKPVRNYFRAH